MNKQLLIILLFSLGLGNVAMGADQGRSPEADQRRSPKADQRRSPKADQRRSPKADQRRSPQELKNAFYDRLHAGGSRRTPSPLNTKSKEKRTTPSPLVTPKARSSSRTPTPSQLAIHEGAKRQPSSPQNKPTGSPQRLSLPTPPRSHSATPPIITPIIVGQQTKKVADELKLVHITEPTKQSTQLLPQIAAPQPYKPEPKRRLAPKSDDHSAGALSLLPAVQKQQTTTITRRDDLLKRLPGVQVQEKQPTSSYFGARETLPTIEKKTASASMFAPSSKSAYSEPTSVGTFTIGDIEEDEADEEELAQAFTPRTYVYRTPKQKILDEHNKTWQKMPMFNAEKIQRIRFAYDLTKVKEYDLSDEERQEKNDAYRQPITPLDFRFNAEDIALKALQAEGYM